MSLCPLREMARRHRLLKRAACPSASAAAFGGMRGLNPIRRIDVYQSSRTMLLMTAPTNQKAPGNTARRL